MTRLVLYAGFFVRVSEHLAVLMIWVFVSRDVALFLERRRFHDLCSLNAHVGPSLSSCHAQPWHVSSCPVGNRPFADNAGQETDDAT